MLQAKMIPSKCLSTLSKFKIDRGLYSIERDLRPRGNLSIDFAFLKWSGGKVLAEPDEYIGVLILDITPAIVPGQHLLLLPVHLKWFPLARWHCRLWPWCPQKYSMLVWRRVRVSSGSRVAPQRQELDSQWRSASIMLLLMKVLQIYVLTKTK